MPPFEISLEVCAAAPASDISTSPRDSREVPGRGPGEGPSARPASGCALWLPRCRRGCSKTSLACRWVCADGTSGLVREVVGSSKREGKQVLKLLGYAPKGGPVVSQNVEVSVVQQILIFSAPLLKINNATSRGCVLAGITNGFVPVPIHPIVLWLLPSPLYLTHWSSVLYFF